jgi:hypothetical protein
MTAKDKIEKLTNSWYGYDLFVSLVYFVFVNGIGIFSAITGAIGLGISLFITFWIGRSLMRKSSFTRTVLLILSSLVMILGVLGVGRTVWGFFGEWSLSSLGWAAMGSVGVYMQAKSINTLTDKTVKAYFA